MDGDVERQDGIRPSVRPSPSILLRFTFLLSFVAAFPSFLPSFLAPTAAGAVRTDSAVRTVWRKDDVLATYDGTDQCDGGGGGRGYFRLVPKIPLLSLLSFSPFLRNTPALSPLSLISFPRSAAATHGDGWHQLFVA